MKEKWSEYYGREVFCKERYIAMWKRVKTCAVSSLKTEPAKLKSLKIKLAYWKKRERNG